jgi:hypothetical protein
MDGTAASLLHRGRRRRSLRRDDATLGVVAHEAEDLGDEHVVARHPVRLPRRGVQPQRRLVSVQRIGLAAAHREQEAQHGAHAGAQGRASVDAGAASRARTLASAAATRPS